MKNKLVLGLLFLTFSIQCARTSVFEISLFVDWDGMDGKIVALDQDVYDSAEIKRKKAEAAEVEKMIVEGEKRTKEKIRELRKRLREIQ